MKLKKINEMFFQSMKEAMESADPSGWVKPFTGRSKFPVNAMTKKHYNGINVLSLMYSQYMNGFSSNQWLTFKQKNAVGAATGTEPLIIKGSKGTDVLRFVTYKPQHLEQHEGYYINKKNGQVRNGEVPSMGTMKVYTVFNLDQLEGLPEGMRTSQEIEVKHDGMKVVERVGAKYVLTDIKQACYVKDSDIIMMPRPELFQSEESFLAVMFHELTHWTMKRLERDIETEQEELVAELGSAILCAMCGIEGVAQHPEYLANWYMSLEKNEKYFWEACSMAQKAVDYIVAQSGIEIEQAA